MRGELEFRSENCLIKANEKLEKSSEFYFPLRLAFETSWRRAARPCYKII